MTVSILRGILTGFLAVGILTVPLTASAQQPGKVYRIGWLDHTGLGYFIGTFQEGLRDLGWTAGQNFAVEYRSAGGRYERLPEIAAELVRLPVDVIVAPDTASALTAKNATKTIPIVMVWVGDPIASGLVTSLARPGGNITGMSNVSPDLAGKQLELLSEAVPRLSRVAILWEPGNPDNRPIHEQLALAARTLGVVVQSLEVRHNNDIEPAFSAMARQRARALIVLGGSPLTVHDKIADFALRHKLPMMSNSRTLTLIGGLISYAPSEPPMFRRAAVYVDKILKGTKPADLPVEQPTTFDLVVNLKTAKALGLTIPQAILLRADKIIQ